MATILVVDDDEIIREILKGILGPNGHDVIDVFDDEAALRIVGTLAAQMEQATSAIRDVMP